MTQSFTIIYYIAMWSTWVIVAFYGFTNHNLRRMVYRKNLSRKKKNLPLLNDIEIEQLKRRNIMLSISLIIIIMFHVFIINLI